MFKRDLKPVKSSMDQAQHFYRELEIDVLARTLWGQARSEGAAGMQAMASLILNRLKISQDQGGYWWGNDLIRICQKPYQFSCWNRSDPSYRVLQALTDRDIHFATALRIARRSVSGVLDDSVKGAVHYHEKHNVPYWAQGRTPAVTVGRYVFYRPFDG